MDSKNEKLAQGKTAVSLLYERLASTGRKPIFDLVYDSTSRPTVISNFTYRVKVSDIEKFGTGSTKKSAKQAAAKAMLMSISNGDDISLLKMLHETTNVQEDVFLNQVGNLNTFCARNNLPAPYYIEQLDKDLPSHRMKFYCKCIVGKRSEIGAATSIRGAKHSAAQAMFHTLIHEIENPNDPDALTYELNAENQSLKLKKFDPWPDDEKPVPNQDEEYKESTSFQSSDHSASQYAVDPSHEIRPGQYSETHEDNSTSYSSEDHVQQNSEEALDRQCAQRLLDRGSSDILPQNSELSDAQYEAMTSEYRDTADPEEPQEKKSKLLLLDLGDRDIAKSPIDSLADSGSGKTYSDANEGSSVQTDEEELFTKNEENTADIAEAEEQHQERKTKLRLLELENFDITNDQRISGPLKKPHTSTAEKMATENALSTEDTEEFLEKKSKLRIHRLDLTSSDEILISGSFLKECAMLSKNIGKHSSERNNEESQNEDQVNAGMVVPKLEKPDNLETLAIQTSVDRGAQNLPENMQTNFKDSEATIPSEIKSPNAKRKRLC